MIFAAAVAVILSLLAAERLWPARSEPTDRWRNLQAYGLILAVELTLLPAVTLTASVDHLTVIDLAGWPTLLGILAFTVAMDGAEFAFHRVQHAVPLLWRMHALHHSDPNMNVTTTLRHFWGDPLIKSVTIWPAVALLLKPTPMVVAAYMGISLFNYFLHSNLRINLGRWSWVVNSPAYHRRHHSVEAAHHGCNFAAIFPLFDVLCGTYRRPDGFPETGMDARPHGLVETAIWPLKAR
jgi:sterol desaturase/sphingolipid hydroxylase (fatty acid hydroxylase superfamily)